MHVKVCSFVGSGKVLSFMPTAIEKHLEYLVRRGFTQFLCGMEEGPDLLFARLLLDLRRARPDLKLHCVLSSVSQAQDSPELRQLLAEADSVIYVNRESSRTGLFQRDSWMIAHSVLLFAVSDGRRVSRETPLVRSVADSGREVNLLRGPTPRLTTFDPRTGKWTP